MKHDVFAQLGFRFRVLRNGCIWTFHAGLDTDSGSFAPGGQLIACHPQTSADLDPAGPSA